MKALTQRGGVPSLAQPSWGCAAAPQQRTLCLSDTAADPGRGEISASAASGGAAALDGDGGAAPQGENGPPVCPITLEPVLSASGHLLPDTVALLQKDQQVRWPAFSPRRAAIVRFLLERAMSATLL